MIRIELSKAVWQFDPAQPLGPAGGFGTVFLGLDHVGSVVAVKRLHLNTKQHSTRELQIADYLLGHDHPHVIPIYDVGFDGTTGYYYIVMARADQSLQELIDKPGSLAESEVLEISAATASGLEEIGRLVHRDLKPGNVLLHNGIWKLADLGLARFVEASTSSNTMEGFLTAQYAAPEQWRNERSTKATDIYALGCIIYALITGAPPFGGPTKSDYSYQHQFEPPPQLPASAHLRQIAQNCLAKQQQNRPVIQTVQTQIQRALIAAGVSRPSPLAEAAAIIAEGQANEHAARELEKKVRSERSAVAREAVLNLRQILTELSERIKAQAPSANFNSDQSVIELGTGRLSYSIRFPLIEQNIFNYREWDILAGAVITVENTWWEPMGRPSRSANLWFGQLLEGDGYRWWEVSYMNKPPHVEHAHGGERCPPYALERINNVQALRHGWYQLATNPRPVDGDHLEDFFDRWITTLAKAATQRIGWGTRLPEEPIEAKFL